MACAAGVIPAVLGSRSQLLDLGRRVRLYTKPQRVAMAVQQGFTCAVERCDVPTAWADAHHLDGWAFDGRTDVADGVLEQCGWVSIERLRPGGAGKGRSKTAGSGTDPDDAAQVVRDDDDARGAHLADPHASRRTVRQSPGVPVGEVTDPDPLARLLGLAASRQVPRCAAGQKVDDVEPIAGRTAQPRSSPSGRRHSIQRVDHEREPSVGRGLRD